MAVFLFERGPFALAQESPSPATAPTRESLEKNMEDLKAQVQAKPDDV